MKNENIEKESETVCEPENSSIHEKDQSIPQNGKINPPENNVRKRKFTWTPKRKEAFQKCIEANKKRIALKNEKLSEKKESKPEKPKQIVPEEDKESVCSDSSSASECSSSSSSTSSSSSSCSSIPVKKKRRKPVTRPSSTKKVKKAIKKSKQELLKSIHSIKKVLKKKPVIVETPKQSNTDEIYNSDSDSNSSYTYYPSFKFI